MNNARREETPERPLVAGTITKMTVQVKDRNRLSVFLDGRFAWGVHQDVVLEHGLVKGQHLSADQQKTLREADAFIRAKATALQYLGHRPRTEAEVRAKLKRSGFSEAVQARTLARLHELAYLDDVAYAKLYVERRFANKGYGPQRLRSELIRRGVARDVIEQTLARFTEETDTLDKAREQAAKRWQRLQSEPDMRKRTRKVSDFLVRRGFTYDTIRQVVDELKAGEQ